MLSEITFEITKLGVAYTTLGLVGIPALLFLLWVGVPFVARNIKKNIGPLIIFAALALVSWSIGLVIDHHWGDILIVEVFGFILIILGPLLFSIGFVTALLDPHFESRGNFPPHNF